MIFKEPIHKRANQENWFFTKTARSAFLHILRKERDAGRTLLLPAYIGMNAYEGSGVFDVVRISRIAFEFYPLSERLEPILTELEQFQSGKFSLLLIHYFGFFPSNFGEILDLSRRKEWHLIEDCAHSLDGQYEGQQLGTLGEFGFHALHKVLPTSDGGILRNNRSIYDFDIYPEDEGIKLSTLDIYCRSQMDNISAIRKANFDHYLKRLGTSSPHFTLFHNNLPKGVVPLNFPILIAGNYRERIYFQMSEQDVVPVALYYKMIPEVEACNFESTRMISSSILNFPVHQDTLPEDIDRVCDVFLDLIDQL